MIQRIYHGQYGWFIVAKNYKDKEDKTYVNIHFTGDEPRVTGDYIDIELINAWLTCYKGKVGMTIKEYSIPQASCDKAKESNEEWAESVKDTPYASKFGGSIEIKPDELPFY